MTIIIHRHPADNKNHDDDADDGGGGDDGDDDPLLFMKRNNVSAALICDLIYSLRQPFPAAMLIPFL